MAKLPQASRSNVSERLSSWTSAPPTEKLPAPASNSSSSRKERTPSAKPTVAKPASSKPPASADTKPARHDELLILDVLFGANQTSASLSKRVLIRSSGVHYLVLSSCEPRTGAVAFSGRTVWKNPYGYLPAELFPFLPFFGQVALAYLALSLGWAYMCRRHWEHLLPLQVVIGWVLVLGVVEGATWYLAYRAFNHGGARGTLPTIVGVLVSTTRKTVARLLVLAACLGYGVVRPTLDTPTLHRMCAFGAAYFSCSAAHDVCANISNMAEYSIPVRLLLVLPTGLLDAAFYFWAFGALTSTLGELGARSGSAKMLLYRRFSRLLAVAVTISAIWISSQLGLILADDLDGRWASLWLFDAFWHVLYFGLLLAITILWSPSANNLQLSIDIDELPSPATEVGMAMRGD